MVGPTIPSSAFCTQRRKEVEVLLQRPKKTRRIRKLKRRNSFHSSDCASIIGYGNSLSGSEILIWIYESIVTILYPDRPTSLSGSGLQTMEFQLRAPSTLNYRVPLWSFSQSKSNVCRWHHRHALYQTFRAPELPIVYLVTGLHSIVNQFVFPQLMLCFVSHACYILYQSN